MCFLSVSYILLSTNGGYRPPHSSHTSDTVGLKFIFYIFAAHFQRPTYLLCDSIILLCSLKCATNKILRNTRKSGELVDSACGFQFVQLEKKALTWCKGAAYT